MPETYSSLRIVILTVTLTTKSDDVGTEFLPLFCDGCLGFIDGSIPEASCVRVSFVLYEPKPITFGPDGLVVEGVDEVSTWV